MIDTVLNLLFRCPHRRLTRPVTPVSRTGVPHGETYVVCLDCGKQFAYDTREMRIGKPIETSQNGGVLHPAVVRPQNRKKLGFALLASLPLVMLIGSALKSKKQDTGESPESPHGGRAG
jgi:DNA-directed RNA polymerase subunit RPC12/RpoP